MLNVKTNLFLSTVILLIILLGNRCSRERVRRNKVLTITLFLGQDRTQSIRRRISREHGLKGKIIDYECWCRAQCSVFDCIRSLGPQTKAFVLLSSCLSGWVSSARLGMYLLDWFKIPRNLHSSCISVGFALCFTADTLLGSGRIPSFPTSWPRNLTLALENSHFWQLDVTFSSWSLSKTASSLSSYSAWLPPYTTVSSIWHSTQGRPSRILCILFWKCSGAEEIPNERRDPRVRWMLLRASSYLLISIARSHCLNQPLI